MRRNKRRTCKRAQSLIVATQSLRTAGYENEGKHLLPRCFPTIRKNQLCGTWIIPQIMSVRNRIRYFFFPFFQINTIIRQFGSVMPFSFCNLRKIQSGKVARRLEPRGRRRGILLYKQSCARTLECMKTSGKRKIRMRHLPFACCQSKRCETLPDVAAIKTFLRLNV